MLLRPGEVGNFSYPEKTFPRSRSRSLRRCRKCRSYSSHQEKVSSLGHQRSRPHSRIRCVAAPTTEWVFNIPPRCTIYFRVCGEELSWYVVWYKRDGGNGGNFHRLPQVLLKKRPIFSRIIRTFKKFSSGKIMGLPIWLMAPQISLPGSPRGIPGGSWAGW